MSDNPYFIDYPYPCQCGDTSNLHVSSTNLSKISAKNLSEVITLIVKEILTNRDENGNIIIDGEVIPNFTPPVATKELLGGVIVGDGLSVDENGEISPTTKIVFIDYDQEILEGEPNTIYIRRPSTDSDPIVIDGDNSAGGLINNIILNGGNA